MCTGTYSLALKHSKLIFIPTKKMIYVIKVGEIILSLVIGLKLNRLILLSTESFVSLKISQCFARAKQFAISDPNFHHSLMKFK